MTVKEYNGVKLIISYSMFEKASGELRAEGTSAHCFTAKEGKLLNLKKAYPVLHTALLNAAPSKDGDGESKN